MRFEDRTVRDALWRQRPGSRRSTRAISSAGLWARTASARRRRCRAGCRRWPTMDLDAHVVDALEADHVAVVVDGYESGHVQSAAREAACGVATTLKAWSRRRSRRGRGSPARAGIVGSRNPGPRALCISVRRSGRGALVEGRSRFVTSASDCMRLAENELRTASARVTARTLCWPPSVGPGSRSRGLFVLLGHACRHVKSVSRIDMPVEAG
jgi:hypothetical protein